MIVQLWGHDARPRPYLTETSLIMGNELALNADVINSREAVFNDVYVRGAHLRAAAAPIRIDGQLYGYVQVATSLRTVDAAIDRLLKIMLISGAFTLLASLLLGDLLARRALKPIEIIGQTARRITAAGDLSLRIPYHGPPDEVGRFLYLQPDARTPGAAVQRAPLCGDVSHRYAADHHPGQLDLLRRIGYDEEAMEAIERVRRMTPGR